MQFRFIPLQRPVWNKLIYTLLIYTLVNDKVKPTSNKLESLTKLANDYNTFTKTSNNVDSNTKFILVIDSQKKVEEKKETKTTKKANETFMDRVKNLFK